jgi:hypothetical protein
LFLELSVFSEPGFSAFPKNLAADFPEKGLFPGREKAAMFVRCGLLGPVVDANIFQRGGFFM